MKIISLDENSVSSNFIRNRFQNQDVASVQPTHNIRILRHEQSSETIAKTHQVIIHLIVAIFTEKYLFIVLTVLWAFSNVSLCTFSL